jgi:hypothetical protein
MKKNCQFALLFVLLAAGWSCSDNFLYNSNQNNTTLTYSSDETLPFFPDAAQQEHTVSFIYDGLNNEEFSIVSIPRWMNITSHDSRFVGGKTTFTCETPVYEAFSKVGLYYDNIILDIVGKGRGIVPAVYISEGSPTMQCADELEMQYPNIYYPDVNALTIKNTGLGILFAAIDIQSDWLIFENYWTTNVVLLPETESTVYFDFKGDFVFDKNATATVVITSNDKNNSRHTVHVTVVAEDAEYSE